MKYTAATVSALLLASTAVARPTSSQGRQAYERRMAQRAARGKFSSHPPLAVNHTSMQDTIKIDGTRATDYDSNWGGALFVSSGITQVSAVANFPSVSIPPGGSSTTQYGGAAWVGIDGDTCDSAILQTGIDWVLEGSSVTYAAWYEWYPAPLTDFSGFSVSPGDEIAMSVVATSLTGGTATITNQNTGQTVTQTFSGQPSLCGQNAEWIVEDFSENGGLIPFAEFSPVTFTDASWVANGATKGVSGATILDIQQNNQVLTNCGVSGSSTVTCSYTG